MNIAILRAEYEAAKQRAEELRLALVDAEMAANREASMARRAHRPRFMQLRELSGLQAKQADG